ncbi:MAG: D-alanine--D-alanine ligase family protein [Eubacteriales bacterium]|nr:D-alanine--D-alanine ligase family protein [Eubacteriales bacterium]
MKIKIAVLFGGKSTEHEVSIISAIQALNSFDKEKYELLPIYISKDGDFYYNDKEKFLDVNNFKDTKKLLSESTLIYFVKENNKVYIKEETNHLFKKGYINDIDIFFPIVHGTNVEDGVLQGFLQMYNIPCVGSSVLSSAVGMDKYIMKKFLMQEGIPVLDGDKFNINDYKDEENLIERIEKKYSYPVIIKPINLGSSIGISISKDKNTLKSALSLAFSFSEEIVVEKAIVNLREINCAVLGDKYNCIPSMCEEAKKKGDILSFENKYIKDDSTKQNTNSRKAQIDDGTREYIEKISMDTFKAIGCAGVARVDCMIDVDSGKIYVNEINTIPGSLSFYLFEGSGIKYQELLDRLIKIALDNFRRREKINFTFGNNLLSNHKLFKNK